MKIIFLSHTPRNSIFKVGSYHLSNEFAKMGHQVLYISSALSPFHLLNIPMFKDKEYLNLLRVRLKTLTPLRDEHDVINLTPFILTPFNKGIFDRPEIPLKQWFTFNLIHKRLEKIGFNEADLVIQDKVGLYFMRKFIHSKRWIYRATDDYSNMPGGPGKASIQKLEKIVTQYADQVLVTSAPLQSLFKKRYEIEATVIRNGVDIAHFEKPRERPAEYNSINEPIILYLGSMDERLDLSLLLNVARKNSNYHYVIIGPGSKEAIPQNISNITALGPVPYEKVPAYMQHADVGILPLKLTEANHARSPMKMYEYGICGLPVVSTSLQEIKSRNEDFVNFAEDEMSFYEQIRYSIEHKTRFSEIAKKSSSNHSWNAIAKQILEISGLNSKNIYENGSSDI